MKLKALIVDDEYPARQELRYMLDDFDNVEIVGEAANASEALKLIKALDYHVLFLDISMPRMNGLELGAEIQKLNANKGPKVVFTTAYDEYAVKAFDVNAVDYVLKPIDEKRLRQAIEKVYRLHKDDLEVNDQPAESKLSTDDVAKAIKINRIPAEKLGKTLLVDVADVYYAFTEKDYVYIKTYDDKFMTRFTLKNLEARLKGSVFYRTHRCYLVNLNKVKEIVPFFNGTYNLVLDDEEKSEVPLSRSQAKKLRKILGF